MRRTERPAPAPARRASAPPFGRRPAGSPQGESSASVGEGAGGRSRRGSSSSWR